MINHREDTSDSELIARKLSEAELYESEELFQAAFNIPSIGMCQLEPYSGCFLRVNRYFCEMTGYSEGELLNRPFSEITHPEDRDSDMQPILSLMHGEISERHIEKRYLHKDGGIRWGEVTVNLVRGPGDRPLRTIVVIQDITARKQAEEMAVLYRSQLESAFQAIQDELVVIDMEGNFLLVNDSQARMNRFLSAEVKKQNLAAYQEIYELNSPDGSRVPFEEWPINKIFKGETIKDWELRATRKDIGQEWFLSFSGKPVFDAQGKQILAVVGIHDITESKRVAEAVRKSEEKYRTLFESIEQGFCTIEVLFDEHEKPVDCRFLEVNPAFQRQMGVEHAVDRRMHEIAPLQEEYWLRIYGHIALTGEPRRFEHFAEHVQRFYEVYAWRIGRPEERTVATLFNDITERKQAEQALRASEARMGGIINSAMDAIISINDQQRIVLFNLAAEKMFGYSAQEILGQSLTRLIPARFRAAHEQHVRRFSRTGETTRAMGALSAVSGLRRDGEEFPIEASISQIEIGGQQLFTVILRDITERIRANDRLVEQAALLDQAHEGILVHDLGGCILYWSRGAERLYGWTAEEAVGRSARELHYNKDASQLARATQLTIKHGEWNGELRHVTKDGREVIVEGQWTLLRDEDGQPKSILAINTDLTEKRKLESQFLRAQRIDGIGALASGIAHDLNNVLAPILMAIYTLQQRFTDKDSQQWLSLISQSAERGRDLITQVLTFARGSVGKRLPLKPADLVNDTVNILRETLPKNILIQVSLPEDLWEIAGDITQLHQVLLNLCLNARDAMPNGGKLVIMAENLLSNSPGAKMSQSLSGQCICLTVADTGIGIPEHFQDRIFEPFFTTKPLGQGTGLGLTTTLGIVKSHGGWIDMTSKTEVGTQFRIYLPANNVQSAEAPATPVEGLSKGNNELVLLAEDESDIREITKATLEAFGYRVLAASNGQEALALFQIYHKEIRVVLTDVLMPTLGGVELVRSLNESSPDVRIIVTSGLPFTDHFSAETQMKINAFLSKPYTAEVLLSTLAEVLMNKS